MEEARQTVNEQRNALVQDSDLWSFDYGASESIDAAEQPQVKEESRQSHRNGSRGNRPRNEYSSPPPDYRSSVKDSLPKEATSVSFVSSYYDVGGLYREANQETARTSPPTSPLQHAPVVVRPANDSSPARDVTIKSSPGFQKILKGWNEHHASRKGFISRLFRKEANGKKLDDSVNTPTHVRHQPEPFIASPNSSQMPAELEISPAKVELDSEPPQSASIQTTMLSSHPTDNQNPQSRPSVPNTENRKPANTEPARRNPPDSRDEFENVMNELLLDRSSASSSSVQWDLATSTRRRQTKLEDVPEHSMDELHHRARSHEYPAKRDFLGMKSFQNYSTVFGKACMTGLSWLMNNAHEVLPVEPPVPPNHIRVRWTCKCGEPLFDDFIELISGAAEKLEDALNTPGHLSKPKQGKIMHSASRHRSFGSGNTSETSAPSRSSSMGASSIFSTVSSQSSATSSGDIGEMGLSRGGSASSNKPSESPIANQSESHIVPLGGTAEPLWLLTCCAEAKLTPKVTHLSLDATSVRSDKDVAMTLRGHYASLHSSLSSSLFRLRGLKSIDFVKFELHRNRFADIRAKPHMPPYPHPSALPGFDPSKPDATGGWEQATDYSFEPGHLVPPVGSNYLMHLFKHPHDYELETITLNRMPKKVGGRLEFGNGWGVELVDGFLPARVWGAVLVTFVLASLAFAVVWCTKENKGDVQGAFAVAAWVAGFAGVAFGWVQAVVE